MHVNICRIQLAVHNSNYCLKIKTFQIRTNLLVFFLPEHCMDLRIKSNPKKQLPVVIYTQIGNNIVNLQAYANSL